ncbi:MAG: AraC family transcriptional regulator [Chitinophagaceae bacterium]|nr:AraC family transcriptional regulator [Chitinophagaceae bacterium]
MDPQIFAPPEILKPVVKYFWAVDNPADSPPATLSAFPDGSPGIIMVQSEGGAICDNLNKKLSPIYLHGQTTGPSKISYKGKFSMVGVSLQPHSLKSIFGIDANEFTQIGFDLNLVQDKKHIHLTGQIAHEQSIEGKIKMLSNYLLHQHQANHRQTEEIIKYAVAQIVQSKGGLSLKELLKKLQMSERSLERKFNQSIGISPKLFSRICRFQESLNQLRTNSYDKLSDIAYENDYADQSHLIRTFKEFTGLSPLELIKQNKK